MPSTDILQDVTDRQREAIVHAEGPMLVLAGAGTGKTRVITRRIAWLIDSGVPARSILSITFTNKAANEMKERVDALLQGRAAPDGGGRPWVSTFHSFCTRLLREDIGLLGYAREFTIYDEDDAETAVKEALTEVGAPDDLRPGAARGAISRWKSSLVGPDQAYVEASRRGHRQRLIAEAYRLYEKALRGCLALDFDDLLLRALEVLRVHEAAREKWRRRFGFLQVDEYQDTNRIQYELVRILAGEARNVVAVGDPDQSIYSWRGADRRNIVDFTRDFPDARVVRLDRNFRSVQAVLDAAGSLVSLSPGARAGALEGVRGVGERARLVVTGDETHEAAEIARGILGAIESGRRARDCAVFYRTNAQSRAIERALLERGIPYAVVGNVAFYRRREVKEALAYLHAAVNPSDEVAFRRVVNTPRRGVGARALAGLATLAAETGARVAEAARDPAVRARLAPRVAKALEKLDALLGRLGELAKGPAGRAVHAAVEATGLLGMYRKAGEDDRVENLDELVAAAAGYDAENPEGGLAGFMEEAALVSDVDRWESESDRAALMTLHLAKGLEFPVVFIAGLEDGLLPHARSINDENPDAIEEERRLLYVGMTRARDRLVLSHARSRMRGGRSQMAVRSRLLGSIPASLLEVDDLCRDVSEWESRARPGVRRPFRRAGPRDEFAADVPPDEPGADEGRRIRKAIEAAEDLDAAYSFEVGDLVRHPKFGRGRVLAIKGAGRGAKVTAEFLDVGRKTIDLGFVALSKE